MDHIPTELKFRSLYNVPFSDILNVCRSSVEYRDICTDEDFWRLKAEYQLGIPPKIFNKTKLTAKNRFIQLYLQKYPIPGCDKYNSPFICLTGLLNLMAQGYTELQQFNTFELLKYYLSMDHTLLVRTINPAALLGLNEVVIYILEEVRMLDVQDLLMKSYLNAIDGATRGHQLELLNYLITKSIELGKSKPIVLSVVLVAAAGEGFIDLLNWVWNQMSFLSPCQAIIEAIKKRQVVSLDFFKSKGVDINKCISGRSILNNQDINFINNYLRI